MNKEEKSFDEQLEEIEELSKETKRKEKGNNTLLTAATVAILLGGGLGVYSFKDTLFPSKGQGSTTTVSTSTTESKEVEQTEPPVVSEEEQEAADERADEEFNREKSRELQRVIGLEEVWETYPYDVSTGGAGDRIDKETLTTKLIDFTEGTSFINMSENFMPKEYIGNESEISEEEANYIFGLYINRFINPTFGGWDAYQLYSKYTDLDLEVGDFWPGDLFSDMFTDKWWAKNITPTDYSKLPVVVDQKMDGFGDINFTNKVLAGLYGTVTNVKSNGQVKYTKSGIRFKVRVNVDYLGKSKKGRKVTAKGVMDLVFVENPDLSRNPNKLLIDDVQFKLGEVRER